MTVLNREQAAILYHTTYQAAGKMYCGGGPDMDRLVDLGLMTLSGRKSFVTEPYYTITPAGCAVERSPAFRAWASAGQRGNVEVAIPEQNPKPKAAP